MYPYHNRPPAYYGDGNYYNEQQSAPQLFTQAPVPPPYGSSSYPAQPPLPQQQYGHEMLGPRNLPPSAARRPYDTYSAPYYGGQSIPTHANSSNFFDPTNTAPPPYSAASYYTQPYTDIGASSSYYPENSVYSAPQHTQQEEEALQTIKDCLFSDDEDTIPRNQDTLKEIKNILELSDEEDCNLADKQVQRASQKQNERQKAFVNEVNGIRNYLTDTTHNDIRNATDLIIIMLLNEGEPPSYQHPGFYYVNKSECKLSNRIRPFDNDAETIDLIQAKASEAFKKIKLRQNSIQPKNIEIMQNCIRKEEMSFEQAAAKADLEPKIAFRYINISGKLRKAGECIISKALKDTDLW